jgi:phosphomannomutase / phosphoglucomutase
MSPAQDAWKPCDLRGIYPDALSEDLLRRVGVALGCEMVPGETVVVAGDFRTSTPSLKHALIEGLLDGGLRVLDCGQVPTPLAYFQAAECQASGVCIVTASHNPASYNGLKWMVHGLPPLPADMARVRSAAENNMGRRLRGSVRAVDPAPAYRSWILSQWRPIESCAGPIVVDAGDGAWSRLGPQILRELGFSVVCLFCEPDGAFPNRPADCARTANLGALRRTVVEHRARLGIAWDGDGDRVAFVDENGIHATADEIAILLAREVLTRAGFYGSGAGERVVCDIKLSEAVRREVLRLGGRPLIERSGHAFMRHRLLTTQAILGLDACGHYFFREAGSRDDGLYSALFLMRMLGNGGSLAAMRESAGPLYSTPELRIPESTIDYDTVLARLREAFRDAEESSVDGARLVMEDGIVLARASSTEPVVSLRVEAFSERELEDLLARCLATLGEARELLLRQVGEA